MANNKKMKQVKIGHSYAMGGYTIVEYPAELTDKKEIIEYIKEHDDEYPIDPGWSDEYLDGSYKVDGVYWDDGDVTLLD